MYLINKKYYASVFWFFAVLSLLFLAACSKSSSSGSGSPGGTQNGQALLSGTAASGRAIANAALTVVDAAGHTKSTNTAADGTYSLDTTGLTPPFLVLVADGTGAKLYSVSADANATTTVNVTPLTDLIIRSWYSVQGVSIDTAFTDPAAYPAPTPTSVAVVGKVVQNIVQLWLNQAGVTSSNFNLISTPFTANATGVDQVLDWTSVNATSGSIVISDGTTTQNTTLSATTADNTLTVTSTTSNANGTSSSTDTAVIPVSSPQQTALDAVTTVLNNFAATVNTKGTSLQASDIMPYLDPGLVNDGLDATQFAADTVSQFQGVTLSFTVQSIKALDTVNNVAEVLFLASGSQGGQTQTMPVDFFFKDVNGSWLLSGNHRIASLDLVAEMRVTEGGACTNCTGPDINVDVEAPKNGSVSTVTGATLSGGILSGATLTSSSVAYDSANNLYLDHYYYNTGTLQSNQLPAVGTAFTINLATASGPVSYTLASNAWTTEAISITSPSGGSMTSIPFGTPLSVDWTLPQTFPIAEVQLSAESFTGANNTGTQCEIDGPILGTTATTGSITIPSTCGGQPVVDVNLNLAVKGVNGERITVISQFY